MAKVQGLEIKRKTRRVRGMCEVLHQECLTRALIMVNGLPQRFSKESSDLQENGNLTSPAFIPSTGRRAFPSNNIPSLFNYGHVHYYALESIPLNLDNTEDIEDGLGTYD